MNEKRKAPASAAPQGSAKAPMNPVGKAPMKQQPTKAVHKLPKMPNVIAVASGKGGVGKTWFSITLAQTLAKRGDRVLLFDADLGLANVDVQLGLTPTRDLGGVLQGRLGLGQAVTHYADGGFDILAGRSGTGTLAQIPPQKLMDLGEDLSQLAKDYNHVILDLGAGIDRVVRLIAGWASKSLVVTTADPTSLTDAYAYIKVIHQSDPDIDMRIVVNQADTSRDGERTFQSLAKACGNFLGFQPELLGVIRRDRKVADAIRSQTGLLSRHPSSDAASDVAKAVEVLLEGV